MNDSLPYSVAVIADIHGNVAALNAVLEDLQSQPYDRLVVAGELSAQRILQARFRPVM